MTAYVFENSQRDWKSKIIIDLRASLSIGRSPCLCLSHVSLQMKRGNFHFPSFLQSRRKVGHLFRQAKILPASLCVSLSVCISLFSIPAISLSRCTYSLYLAVSQFTDLAPLCTFDSCVCCHVGTQLTCNVLRC